MPPENNDIKRRAGSELTATKMWVSFSLILAVIVLTVAAAWFLGGDRFPSTPTMGGVNGKAPGAKQAPNK